MVAVGYALTACSDSSPVAPTAAPEPTLPEAPLVGLPRAEGPRSVSVSVKCTVTVATGAVACGPRTGTAPLDVRFSETSPNVTLNQGAASLSTTAVDVYEIPGSVTNQMAQPFGTSDGITVSGLKVYFTNLSVDVGTGDIAVTAETGFCDCTGTNGGALVEPYFGYNEIVQPYQTSSSLNWQFQFSNGTVSQFSYTAHVIGALPEETAALRWVKDMSQGTGTDQLYSVHGRTNAEAWSVGDAGRIYRYNGTTWSQVNGIGATSPLASANTQQLRAIYGWGTTGRADRATYAAGFNGTVLRSIANVPAATPGQWQDISTRLRHHADSATNPLRPFWYGVWCGGAGNCVFVGSNGQIRRFDGSADTLMTNGNILQNTGQIASGKILTSVFGFGAGTVYAVGQGGTFLLWRGNTQTWSTIPTGTTATLYNVWGFGTAGSHTLYLAGANGTLLRSVNGAAPTPVTLPPGFTTAFLWGMWGTGANDIYVAAANGNVLHFNGTTWRVHSTNQTSRLYGMWGTASTDMFGVGQNRTILRGRF